MQQNNAATSTELADGIERFEYPSGDESSGRSLWNGWEEVAEEGSADDLLHGHSKKMHETATHAEVERRLSEEKQRAFEAGRERGRQEGAEAERQAQAAALAALDAERRQQYAALVENFERERDRYLQAVEHEVVKLALAVAARILRREAQMDPLLLTGAVRVALGQLAGSTEVRLRVPAADLAMWTEAIALVPNLAVRPQVMAGEGMRLGECVVETDLGTVDLGIRSQLAEIERGFFDRAAQPPRQIHPCAGREAGEDGEAEA